MAPKKPLSSSSSLRRAFAVFSSIRPAERSASIAICLPGIEFELEAGGDFGDTARTLGDDDEVHDHQDREHDDADHEITGHHEVAERLDDVAGGRRALMALRQDQPGRGHVQRQPQHGRDQEDGRKRREFQRRLDEQRGHQDQDRDRDRDRQEQVQHDRGQRQDQHHQDGENAERQRQIAALEDVYDVGEAKTFAGACALTCRDVDHGCSAPPRLAATAAERIRDGRRAAGPKVRYRTGVHGILPHQTRSTTLDFTRQLLPGAWLAKG